MRTLARSWSGLALVLLACSAEQQVGPKPLARGQSEFVSSPPQNNGGGGLLAPEAGAPTADGGSRDASSTPRKVEETDLYRLEGDRLYYLNAYRGLMVFDVSNVDEPALLSRSPIYGQPIEMVVRGGIATVVVSDWYGETDAGVPYHGSIVRSIDARDASKPRVLGEALLGGWVQDTRVVGDVLYAVTQKYGWDLGWHRASEASASSNSSKVTVSSVHFANGAVSKADEYEVPGFGGIFHVTPEAILLASSVTGEPDQNGYAAPTGETELTYVDITDPLGSIAIRGRQRFQGYMQGWGADNGRWNLDFADGVTAHALACAASYCGGNGQDLLLATVDFSDPDAPETKSELRIPGNTWSPTARFDGERMYLSPSNGYVYTSGGVMATDTPIQIYDLSDPSAPALRGSANVRGEILNFFPAGDRLFALGSQYGSTGDRYGSQVALSYLDVTNPASVRALGTATFGDGWAWTPAAGTFKAFTKSDQDGLVVLPFSGYSNLDYSYNNGLQLLEFTPNSITTSGAAKTKGWVERGIFVKERLVSLSDLALSVVDYSNRAEPRVVTELTLARNVIDALPRADGKVAELSSDWWDQNTRTSSLRLLPANQVEELSGDATLSELELSGINPSVFHDGNLSYVLTQVSRRAACENDPSRQCEYWHTRAQVVDGSGSEPRLRGALDLPESIGRNYWGWGWGFWGCGLDWYYGSTTLQVGGHLLATQSYRPTQNGNSFEPVLSIVDLSDPDQPAFGQTSIADVTNGWWGNLRAAGDQLYATHYEWVTPSKYENGVYQPGVVKYFLDRIDLSTPSTPRVSARVNVPGMLAGVSETNPNLIYTIDYSWSENRGSNQLAVLLLEGDTAYLQGSVEVPGYVGNLFVREDRAYFTAQVWEEAGSANSGRYKQRLYEADLSDFAHPTLHESTPSDGWGWLVAVEGDRAFVTSGWGDAGIDVFKLTPGAAPVFDQFVRVRGFWPNGVSRRGNDVYFATGYWGTEHIQLND